jgi:hypothetical protein
VTRRRRVASPGRDLRAVRSDRSPLVYRKEGHPSSDPTLCMGCGALFRRKKWIHVDAHALEALPLPPGPGWCPACRQVRVGRSFGRVVIRGGALAGRDAIERRIRNVAERAGFTQPLRRVITVDARGADLEVLTTSEKLAHRVAHELRKAFGGHVSYKWRDRDGALLAVWQPTGS